MKVREGQKHDFPGINTSHFAFHSQLIVHKLQNGFTVIIRLLEFTTLLLAERSVQFGSDVFVSELHTAFMSFYKSNLQTNLLCLCIANTSDLLPLLVHYHCAFSVGAEHHCSEGCNR